MTRDELNEQVCNQSVIIKNGFWELKIQNENFAFIGQNQPASDNQNFNQILRIHDDSYWTSNIIVEKIDKIGLATKLAITGIYGGFYLYSQSEDKDGQSIKLIDQDLIFSLGDTFLSLNLKSNQFNWLLQPDLTEVFEFYDLQDDFIVRGETEVHRIDRNGNKLWSFGGQDIWVNLEGENEVIILEDKILLTDFNSSKYFIDFDGKQLEFIPYTKAQPEIKKRWWHL